MCKGISMKSIMAMKQLILIGLGVLGVIGGGMGKRE